MWRSLAAIAFCVVFWGCGSGEEPPGDAQSGGSGPMAGSGGSGAGPQAGSGGTGGSAPTCTPDPGASSPEVIDQELSGSLGIYGVAVNETGVYWSKDGEGIKRLRPGASTSEVVVPMERGAPMVTSTHVYFKKGDALWRAPLDPIPAAATLVADLPPNGIFVVDETTVYARDDANMRIVTVPVTGGTPASFVAPALPTSMLLHGGFLYFSDFAANRVLRVPVSGGTPTPVSPAANLQPNGIATDGTTLFWIDQEDLKRTPLSDPTQETVLGDARGDLAVLLGGRVYFAGSTGNVVWIAADGSSCGSVTTGAAISNSGWAVDQQFAYLASFGGETLWRFHHN